MDWTVGWSPSAGGGKCSLLDHRTQLIQLIRPVRHVQEMQNMSADPVMNFSLVGKSSVSAVRYQIIGTCLYSLFDFSITNYQEPAGSWQCHLPGHLSHSVHQWVHSLWQRRAGRTVANVSIINYWRPANTEPAAAATHPLPTFQLSQCCV